LHQRVFVESLQLHPIKLNLSLRLAPRPATAQAAAAAERDGEAHSVAGLLERGWRVLGSTLINAEQVPFKMPKAAMHRVLLPYSSLIRELQQHYSRALVQQAYKLLPSSWLFGDPYGMLRQLRKDWRRCRQELRHSAWQQLPAVLSQGTGRLVRSVASKAVRAGSMSTVALSRGLAAMLSEGDAIVTADIGLVDALLRGVGGVAKETARGTELVVGWLQAHTGLLSLGIQGLLLSCAVPLGLGYALRHLLLFTMAGSLSAMRSSLDVVRLVVQVPPLHQLGRARPPRLMAACALLVPYCESVHDPLVQSILSRIYPDELYPDLIHSMTQPDQQSIVLITTSAIICVTAHGIGSIEWKVNLVDVLLLQERATELRIVCLPTDSSSVRPACDFVRHTVMAASADLASQLHELVRVAALNARRIPFSCDASVGSHIRKA